MKKTVLIVSGVLLASLAFAQTGGADTSFQALCQVLDKVQRIAPVVVKVLAFIILLAGLIAGGFMVIDRERNMMGRGILVIAFAIIMFSLMWVLANPFSDVIQSARGALGCGS